MHISSNANTENYKKATKLALASVIANFPNFILVTISAFTSHSSVVWVDVLVSFGETTHAALVWLVTRKMVHETGDRFNFGMGRMEVFLSFICDLLVTVGMIGVSVGSLMNILTPVAPSSSVLMFCILKCINSTYDAIAFYRQDKITKENPSKLNETERITYRDSLINDVSVGALALICYLLRGYSFSVYFNPIFSIGLSVFFIIGYVRHMKVSFDEIVDASLPLPRQDEIYDIVLSNRDLVRRISSVNCRRMNNKTHIELSLVFADDVSYRQIAAYLTEVKQQVEILEPDCFLSIVIDPLS